MRFHDFSTTPNLILFDLLCLNFGMNIPIKRVSLLLSLSPLWQRMMWSWGEVQTATVPIFYLCVCLFFIFSITIISIFICVHLKGKLSVMLFYLKMIDKN
ncbi:hypothetical protein S83_006235 [Arachis hypogaea]